MYLLICGDCIKIILNFIKDILRMHILQKARTFVCIIRIRNNHKDVNNLHVSASINLQIKNDIPGPKSLPGIGTLYQYFPVVGE